MRESFMMASDPLPGTAAAQAVAGVREAVLVKCAGERAVEAASMRPIDTLGGQPAAREPPDERR